MPGGIARSPDRPEKWLVANLPIMEYPSALELQRKLVRAKTEGGLSADFLLVLEHPAVFTLGRRGGMEHLRVSADFLHRSGIGIHQVERGGVITYHGPGQLIAYPIVDLRTSGLGVAAFVSRLESVMIAVAATFGVEAEINPRNRGVWVGMEKLGSIGITVRRGVTFHGMALNVNTDLTPFSWINPCGLEGVGVTSLAECRNEPLPMDETRQILIRETASAFRVRMEAADLSMIEALL